MFRLGLIVCIIVMGFLPVNSPVYADVLLNEILPNPDSVTTREENEYIELYNNSSLSEDISNWKLDDVVDGGSNEFSIPAGTNIAPQSFLVFEKSQTNISLNNDKDTVNLIKSDNTIVDSYSYSNTKEEYSYGRNIDGGGSWNICQIYTKGNQNKCQAEEPTNVPTLKSTSTPKTTNTPKPTATIKPIPTAKSTSTTGIVPTTVQSKSNTENNSLSEDMALFDNPNDDIRNISNLEESPDTAVLGQSVLNNETINSDTRSSNAAEDTVKHKKQKLFNFASAFAIISIGCIGASMGFLYKTIKNKKSN